jgi:membrane peptidoglycan carboxypeptidase
MQRTWKNGRNGPLRAGAPPFVLRRYAREQVRAKKTGGAAKSLRLIVVVLAVVAILAPVMMLSAGIAVAAGTYFYYAGQLEGALDALHTRTTFQTTKIYDRNGYLLYEVFNEGRRTEITSLDQVAPAVVSATLAIEDKTFWTNPGVDPVGIARAAVLYLATGEVQGGGSTLTQQFVRNALFTYEDRTSTTMDRKLREIILAVEMTNAYSKTEILMMYLNEIPYGNLSYGIQAAAQGYFGKDARELSLAESTFLAGLPQSPSEYDPFLPGGLEKSKARQWDVLRRMVDDGYLTQDQADAVYNEQLQFAKPVVNLEAPHFVLWVRQLLEEDPEIGPEKLYGGGLNIYTTLDMRYQRLAEAVIHDRMDTSPLDPADPDGPRHNQDVWDYNSNNAAMVVMRPDTGEILAMVGSVDYNLTQPSRCGNAKNVVDGNVNAALAERQPGSSIKPVNYLTAFTEGWGPATMVLDVRTKFPVPGYEDFAPENYSFKFSGPLRLRYALAGSLNMPAVKVLQFAGVPEMLDMAHKVGIRGLNRGAGFYGLSLTLGGGEVTLLDMVTANSTYANEGRYVPPVSVLRIEDAQGNVIRQYEPLPLSERLEVVDPKYVYLLTSILSDDSAREFVFGAHSILQLSRPACVKTGTSEDWSDNWTLGFTPYLVAGVWVGNNNNEPMSPNCALKGEARTGTPGVRTAGRIWHNFMEAVFHPGEETVGLAKYFPDEEKRQTWFANPDLEDVLRDANGNLRLDFRRPAGVVEMDVCAVSGQLPTPYCPVVREVFAEGNTPKETCPVHKAVTVVQFPGSDPPVYCLPVPGMSYPPELMQEVVFLDLFAVAKPEELEGLEEWYQSTGTPRIPTEYCPSDWGTWQPGKPGEPPPENRWGGLVRQITSPRTYAGIAGPIEIRGSADIVSAYEPDQFAYYKIEWGQKNADGSYPDTWYPIFQGNTPVHNGVLAYWDPAGMPDGSYLLRLTVVTKEGRPFYNFDQPGHTIVPIYLDRGGIYVRLLYPPPGMVIRDDQIVLSAKVEGVAPAARVDFFYDGIFIGSAITNTIMPLSERVYTITWSVRPGRHTLTVEAVNTAGRKASSQAVLVEGQPPEGALPGLGAPRAALAWPLLPNLFSDLVPSGKQYAARYTLYAAYREQHLTC